MSSFVVTPALAGQDGASERLGALLAAATPPGASAPPSTTNMELDSYKVFNGTCLNLILAFVLLVRMFHTGRMEALGLKKHSLKVLLYAPAAGYLLQKDLERRGITVHCKGATKAILGTDRAEAVLLEDGTVYPADLVCMAVGIRPETRLANDAHLEVGRGVVVTTTRGSAPRRSPRRSCVHASGYCHAANSSAHAASCCGPRS